MVNSNSFQDLFTKEAVISILGPASAGKTTFARYLETEQPQLESPKSTIGVDYRKKGVRINNYLFTLIDVGGQKIFQEIFWDIAVQKSDGVIFVLDATINPNDDRELFANQIKQLNYAFDIINSDTILLLLMNKQDLIDQHPLSPDKFVNLINSERLTHVYSKVLPISAKFGDGVLNAINWLTDQLNLQKS